MGMMTAVCDGGGSTLNYLNIKTPTAVDDSCVSCRLKCQISSNLDSLVTKLGLWTIQNVFMGKFRQIVWSCGVKSVV